MYNRYVPQPDGSYRRNRVERREPEPPTQGNYPPAPEPPCEEPHHGSPDITHKTSAGDFLKQLLPKGLDIGDLLIIVLLLLMAGDCQEDQNTALLTLALYLFL